MVIDMECVPLLRRKIDWHLMPLMCSEYLSNLPSVLSSRAVRLLSTKHLAFARAMDCDPRLFCSADGSLSSPFRQFFTCSYLRFTIADDAPLKLRCPMQDAVRR